MIVEQNDVASQLVDLLLACIQLFAVIAQLSLQRI